MQHPPLIGLAGVAGSGKDTVRGILARHGYYGLAFADPIRDMIAPLLRACGTGPEWMTDRKLKEQPIPELGISYRQLAQTLGTEWGRHLAPDFWLRIAGATMDAVCLLSFGPPAFVISDVRFANEAAWIHQRGGQVWLVYRPDAEPVRQHASEEGVRQLQVDYTLHNTGSIADLRRTVAIALASQSTHEEA